MHDPRIWLGLVLTSIEASICSIGRKRAQGRQRSEGAPDPGNAIGPIIPKEILDRLPAEVRGTVAEAAAFSGPLPPPSMFSQYEVVLPGSADRIMQMAENEQSHRIDWENESLQISGGEVSRGQWMGFAVSILCIGGTIWLALGGMSGQRSYWAERVQRIWWVAFWDIDRPLIQALDPRPPSHERRNAINLRLNPVFAISGANPN